MPGPAPAAAASSLELGKWALGLVTGAVVWFFKGLIEQRKARTKEAIDACERLRTLLSEWLKGVRDAIGSEGNRDAALQKLETFMTAHYFEPRLREMKGFLREEERACRVLFTQAELFHSAALLEKGRIWEILQESGTAGSYQLNRSQSLQNLQSAYQNVELEIDRVQHFLRGKCARIIPWFGPREPQAA